MANIRDKVGEESQPTGGGMRRVLADGSESVSELREFMGQMRGKSPQEVLGAVANSGLVRSTLVAALGFVIVLFGLSVAVHYWKGPQEKDKTAATPAATPDKKQPDSSPKKPTAESATQAAAANPGDDTTQQSGDQTLDNLGIGETKQTDPKKNPLEDSLDNLLDGTK